MNFESKLGNCIVADLKTNKKNSFRVIPANNQAICIKQASVCSSIVQKQGQARFWKPLVQYSIADIPNVAFIKAYFFVTVSRKSLEYYLSHSSNVLYLLLIVECQCRLFNMRLLLSQALLIFITAVFSLIFTPSSLACNPSAPPAD